MNICPGCEAEMDHGLELCENCVGEGVEEAIDRAAEGPAESGIEEKVEVPAESGIACLELEDGQRFELDREEVILGRSDPVDQIEPDVDLSFYGGFEQGVSRRHAIITVDANGYVLEDLGSTNGTVVNREKLSPGMPVNLVEGDVIHLGKMKAVFHADAGEGGMS
jgi:pSer/pThr/pTyr-binding forkhead associated (FHA) protein